MDDDRGDTCAGLRKYVRVFHIIMQKVCGSMNRQAVGYMMQSQTVTGSERLINKWNVKGEKKFM